MLRPFIRLLSYFVARARIPAQAILLALLVVAVPSLALAQEDDAQKLYDDAMDNDYLNTKFDDAAAKLNKAVKLCGKKCGKSMRGKLHVALAVVYGAGKGDNKTAKAELDKAFAADKNAKPLDLYFTDDLKKMYAEAKKNSQAGDDDDDSGKPPKPPPPKHPKGDDDDDDTGKPKPPPKRPKGDDDDDTGKPKPPPKHPKGDDDDDGGEGGSVDWKPPSEALVNTPLPIFIPVEEGLGAESAKLRYKPFGENKWLSVPMKKMAGGFGALVPCAQITTTGKLKLYIFLKDKAGDPVAQAGSSKAPLDVTIKNELEGDQPSFPGEKSPKKCSTVECPPDFPGCGDKPKGGERGNKGWGASCDKTEECKEGFSCLNGSCEQGGGEEPPTGGGGSGPGPKDAGDHALKKNIISLGVEFDALFLASATDVCGSTTAGPDNKLGTDDDVLTAPNNFFCYTSDGEFLGKPVAKRFNEVQGGGVFPATVRLLLGYDRIIWKGLVAGLRVGYAFGGSPSVGNAQERFDNCQNNTPKPPRVHFTDDAGEHGICREPAAKSFLPAHVEIRLAYMFLENNIKQSKFLPRPYFFTGFGAVGQVNGGVKVGICDNMDASGNNPVTAAQADPRCGPAGTTPARKREDDVTAYQITGLNFVPVGIGAVFPFHPNVGISAELKAMFMLPTFGVVLAPTIGPVGMF